MFRFGILLPGMWDDTELPVSLAVAFIYVSVYFTMNYVFLQLWRELARELRSTLRAAGMPSAVEFSMGETSASLSVTLA